MNSIRIVVKYSYIKSYIAVFDDDPPNTGLLANTSVFGTCKLELAEKLGNCGYTSLLSNVLNQVRQATRSPALKVGKFLMPSWAREEEEGEGVPRIHAGGNGDCRWQLPVPHFWLLGMSIIRILCRLDSYFGYEDLGIVFYEFGSVTWVKTEVLLLSHQGKRGL